MTEAERARDLADFAESEGYIDVGRLTSDDAEDLRLWIKGARLLASSGGGVSSDLKVVVADAIGGVEIVSRFNDWTADRVEGFPIEILDVSGVEIIGDGAIVSRHRAEEGEGECRRAAERAARAAAALSAIDRAGFAVVSKGFVASVENLVTTFEQDEADGYRSKDRQFAVSVLRAALAMRGSPPTTSPVMDQNAPSAEVLSRRLRAASDAMAYAVEEGGVEFLEAWLEDDVDHIRQEWPRFDLASLRASRRSVGHGQRRPDPLALAAEAAALAIVGAGREGLDEARRPGFGAFLRGICEAETLLPQDLRRAEGVSVGSRRGPDERPHDDGGGADHQQLSEAVQGRAGGSFEAPDVLGRDQPPGDDARRAVEDRPDHQPE